jgi:hypothetical protein
MSAFLSDTGGTIVLAVASEQQIAMRVKDAAADGKAWLHSWRGYSQVAAGV